MSVAPVYVRCHSGLGNQLYQYTAATELARHRGSQVLVIGGYSLRLLADTIGLDRLEMNERAADVRIPAVLVPSRPGQVVTRAATRVGRLSTAIFQSPGQHLDPFPGPVEKWATASRPILLDGYFHHPTYFGQSVATVAQRVIDRRTQFSRREGVIGVHVRRGDYLSLGWELSQDFYERSLLLVDPDRLCSVLIASDDVLAARWLGSRFSELGWPTQVISSTVSSPADDLCQLACCQHLVCSNSTFSAWAAYVGDHIWGNDGRKVAVPDPWLPPTDRPPPASPNWIAVPRHANGRLRD